MKERIVLRVTSGQKLDRIEIGLRRLLPNRGVSGSKLNCLFHRSYLLVNEVSLWLRRFPPGRLMAIIVPGRTAARIEKTVLKFQRKVCDQFAKAR